MSELKKCLQCDEDYYAVKAQQLHCAWMSDGDCVEEFHQHRWADWKDHELEAARIHPDAYEKHRRSNIFDLQWAGCEDTLAGHKLAESYADQEWSGARIGQCCLCGYTPDTE